MTSNGYIKLFRSVDESDVMDSPPHIREVWFYLLRRVNFSDCTLKNGLKVNRGQTWVSAEEIREALSWRVGARVEHYSMDNIRQSIRTLKTKGMITTAKTTRKMIVTVCNYDNYQGRDMDENNIENNSKVVSITTAKTTLRNKNDNKKNMNKKITDLDLPFDSYDFKKYWNYYLEHRQSIEKPVRNYEIAKRLLTKLERMGEKKAVLALVASITNGWVRLYDPDEVK